MIVQNLEPSRRNRWLHWLSNAESVYQHVGWHPVAYWLGRPVSLCLQKSDGTETASLLVCPDRFDVAWLHLFAADAFPGAQMAWELLWPAASETLRAIGVDRVWVMTTQSWFAALVRESGFQYAGHVVALMQTPALNPDAAGNDGRVVPIREADLPAIEILDHAAFGIPWQMDSDALRETRNRSILATAFRSEGRILGYQMTVPTAQGVHLARLAVDPSRQRQGIGRLLTAHLLRYFGQRGAPRVTVNTQAENESSLRLYRSLGFQPMGDDYPVYCCTLAEVRSGSFGK